MNTCKCEDCKGIQFHYWLENQDEFYAYFEERGLPALSAIDWSVWEGLPVVVNPRAIIVSAP
jgi:hypothetical protein